jgi:transcriptional antiterminator NusG
MRSLIERVKLAGMEDGFGEILVPTEEVVEMRNGQKRKSERKFFPGYVLVQMDMNEGTWHLVKDTPRVMGFIGGTADKPAPITDKEAEAILRRVADGSDKPKPKTLFEPGEVVRVNDGPFADLTALSKKLTTKRADPGGSAHFRSLYSGRVGVQSGRKGLAEQASQPRSPRLWGFVVTGINAQVTGEPFEAFEPVIGVPHGQEDYRLHQAASEGRSGQPKPTRWSSSGSARREHHGILQGFQRPYSGS